MIQFICWATVMVVVIHPIYVVLANSLKKIGSLNKSDHRFCLVYAIFIAVLWPIALACLAAYGVGVGAWKTSRVFWTWFLAPAPGEEAPPQHAEPVRSVWKNPFHDYPGGPG